MVRLVRKWRSPLLSPFNDAKISPDSSLSIKEVSYIGQTQDKASCIRGHHKV